MPAFGVCQTARPAEASLGYMGSVVSKRNRQITCENVICDDPVLNSCDEFPLASTYEGGAGDPNGLFRPTTYMCVPRHENSLQGLTMVKFYECMGYPQNFVRFDIRATNLPLGGCQPIQEGPADAHGIKELIKVAEPYTGPRGGYDPRWEECILFNSRGMAVER